MSALMLPVSIAMITWGAFDSVGGALFAAVVAAIVEVIFDEQQRKMDELIAEVRKIGNRIDRQKKAPEDRGV